MHSYKIIPGPAAAALSMIPISTPRGMQNLRGGLILNQSEYKYALAHGLNKLLNAKIAVLVADKKAAEKPVAKEAKKQTVKKAETIIKAEEPVKVEQPSKVEEVKVEEAKVEIKEEAPKAEEIKEETVKESSKQESKKSKKK